MTKAAPTYPQGPLSRDTPARAGQLDLHYSIEQFFFDEEADSRLYLRRIEEAVLETAGRPSGEGRVLDVACGTGKQMARLEALGWQACGVDASDDMLRLGLYLSKDVLACERSLRSVAEILPFCDESFDLVICQGSMDHFAQPRQFIAEAARILTPGGRLVVALANYDSLSCLLGRNKAGLLRRLNPCIPDDGFWKIPFDHTFKGTYRYLRGLHHPHLVRRRLYGISLFQFLSPWRKLLSALPSTHARALWRAVDGVAKRLPPLADTLVVEWVKRPDGRPLRASASERDPTASTPRG
jgi:SAM-dependent methyltransferase